jgi:ParB/RepB/Spo0J family partition protein
MPQDKDNASPKPKLKLVQDPEAKRIPIALILAVLPDNIRSEYDAESISKLAAQLREQGQLQSVLVEPLEKPGPNGELFKLVAGYRRYLAAKEAGIDHLFVIVRQFEDEAKALAANAAENIEREVISLYDIVRRIRDLLVQGWSVSRIVQETGADPELTPQIATLLQECAPELIAQLRYDESAKTLSRLEWASKHITGLTKEQKFKNQIEWWKKRTAEDWREPRPKKGKPRSASPEKIAELAERIRAARGLHGASGWVALSPEQAEAVANALAWCASPKGKKVPL